jgi:hypothetical protein
MDGAKCNADPIEGVQAATIDPGVLLDARVSLFAKCKATRPAKSLPLGEFFAAVKEGHWRCEIERIREANRTSKEEANRLKVDLLPVIKASGTFGGSTAGDLLKHSGGLCIDFDNVSEGLDALARSLSADPHVLAFFRSPRGNGLKVFVPVSATNADEHERCALSAFEHFRPLVPEGAKLDTAPRNVSANCFASWDAGLWQATSPRKVFLPAPQKVLPPAPQPSKGGKEEREGEAISEVSVVSMSQWREAGLARAAAVERLSALRITRAHIANIYDKFLAKRPVDRGKRFEFLQKAIPGLFCVVSPTVLVDLLLLHYDLHTGIWSTPRTEHEKEIRSMLSAYAEDYVSKLPPADRLYYEDIKDEATRATFRICRDLAERNHRQGIFFLPYGHLGLRLDLHPYQAQRIMNCLYADRVIELIERGAVWTNGQIPKATSWKWTLPSVPSTLN